MKMESVHEQRRRLVAALLPHGIPRLWCPLLTHYTESGHIDFSRMTAHFHHLASHVGGYLIPGSTGDGWELDDHETMAVVDFALALARDHQVPLLFGVLRPDGPSMKATIHEMLDRLRHVTGIENRTDRLAAAHVCGFALCPPRGKMLDQDRIYRDLRELAGMDVPLALYQLPQVTENEFAPGTFAALISEYGNIIFLKDSSGDDRIALSGEARRGVYFFRGAENDYAQWLTEAGGSYDGFLLSTANSFPAELSSIIEHLEKGERDAAQLLSARVSGAVREIFDVVQALPVGNAFTNGNKAIDHHCAFGPGASGKAGPMLHGGMRIPGEIIVKTGEILGRYGLMPTQGYL